MSARLRYRGLRGALAVVLLAAGCGLNAPAEGTYPCDPGSPAPDCPPGWVCRADGRCWSTPADGGVDVPEADIPDGDIPEADVPEADIPGDEMQEAEDAPVEDGCGCIPECADDGNLCNGREICFECHCIQTRPPDEGSECVTGTGVGGYCFRERCRPTTCGDGAVDSGELCDDGNLVDGDGCEADCTFSCVLDGHCADAELCNGTARCSGHTCVAGEPLPNGASCGSSLVCRGGVCTSGGCGDGVTDAVAGEECDDANDIPGDGCENDCTFTCTLDADCNDLVLCNGEETCDAAAHLCRAGIAAADGTPCAIATGAPGICRGGLCAGVLCWNGAVDTGEQCDDANVTPGDGCESDCTWTCEVDPDCADGSPCNGSETCDPTAHLCLAGTAPPDGTECNLDGNPATREICLGAACRLSLCGDGFVDPGADEQCDDGNAVPRDGCEPTCRYTCLTAADCADGEFCNGDETCETATHLCRPGVYHPDGAACTLPGGTAGVCSAGTCRRIECGNATIDPGEECDDGNAVAGDGCEVTCLFSCHRADDCLEIPDNPCTTDACATAPGGQACTRSFNTKPCNDGSPCTTGDACDGGACRGTLVDGDADTYGPGADCGGDCNDANPDVHPGAIEACNGIDDDCDGRTDNGSTMTCALSTTRSCTATGAGGVLCVGTEACSGTCVWSGVCVPSGAETCNGADDDCDGIIDDGFFCARGTSNPCTATGTGGALCPGTTSCFADCSAYGACLATSAETCDGTDDDCDTLVDEVFSCVRGSTSSCTRTGAGGVTCTGTRTCGADCTWGACVVTTAETCNGIDDDCDGVVDDHLWCAVDPSAAGDDLFAVWGSSAADVWAVGAAGTIIRWNGSVWSAVSSGASRDLLGVWAASSTAAWAVGASSTILRWNGAAWPAETSPAAADWNDVWGASTAEVWACGTGGRIIRRAGGPWATSTSGTTRPLRGLWGAAADAVWAVGDSGTIRQWNGSAWAGDGTGITTQNLYGVGGTAVDDVWVVGASGTILHRTDAVGTWRVLSSGISDLLRGVWASSTSNAWAVGGSGRILHWDGEALTVVPSGTGNTLYGIWGFSAAEVWAVGVGPVILRWRE